MCYIIYLCIYVCIKLAESLGSEERKKGERASERKRNERLSESEGARAGVLELRWLEGWMRRKRVPSFLIYFFLYSLLAFLGKSLLFEAAAAAAAAAYTLARDH